MAVALEGIDLLAWLAFAVAFVLALKAKQILEPIFHVVNAALGSIPFVGDWVKSATGHVLTYLDEIILGSREAMTILWEGFLWSVRETVAVIEDAGGYVEGFGTQLVEHAIPDALEGLYADVVHDVGAVEKELNGLESTVVSNLKAAEHYAERQAAGALTDATKYADKVGATVHHYVDDAVSTAVSGVERDIGAAKRAAIATAEDYADALRVAVEAELAKAIAGVESDLGAAVSTLKAAIAGVSSALTAAESQLETELAHAEATASADLAAQVRALLSDIATAKSQAEAAAAAALATSSAELQQLVTAGETAASSALSAAEAALSSAISTATAAEASALTTAVATLESTIAGVRGEVGAIAGEIAAAGGEAVDELGAIYGLDADAIRRLLDSLDLTKLVDFGAALVLLRALVETFAAEAGLGSAECRALNRQICGVNPSAWADLLGLLADFVLITDICAVIPLLEEGFSVVAAPLIEALTGVAAGLCSPTASPPSTLTVASVELPSRPALDYQLAA